MTNLVCVDTPRSQSVCLSLSRAFCMFYYLFKQNTAGKNGKSDELIRFSPLPLSRSLGYSPAS